MLESVKVVKVHPIQMRCLPMIATKDATEASRPAICRHATDEPPLATRPSLLP